MGKILVINAHPDPDPARLCHALADAYAAGAAEGGHEVRRVTLGALDFPLLRSTGEFEQGTVPEVLHPACDAVIWADHIVFVFPLWLGTMPALLKAFLEQVMRPGVAFAYPEKGTGGFTRTLLKGRSARIVVTMGMPAFLYRYWYLGHGVAGVRRNILNFVGIKPVRETLLGMVTAASASKRAGWLERMRALGRAAG